MVNNMNIKVGIICAEESEAAPFISTLDKCKVTEKAKLKFYEGKIQEIDVVVVASGNCKVNAAIATQILIDTYNVDAVINAGTAGGMNPEVKVFDTVISTEVAYHDVAADILTKGHPFMESVWLKADVELLTLSRMAVSKSGVEDKVYWGRMVTGESFITEEGRQRINVEYSPMTVDMETASVAHVCYVNKTPFIAIRTVTDTANHRGIENFRENCEKASVIARNIVVKLLSFM